MASGDSARCILARWHGRCEQACLLGRLGSAIALFDRFHVVFVGVLGCWQAPVGAVMLELPDVTLGTVSGRRRERRWT
jgi:hypothetical protein